MADIAQLVRALVCGTRCRRFESGYPPHYKKEPHRGVFNCFFMRFMVQYKLTDGRHWSSFLLPTTVGVFLFEQKEQT